MQIKNTTDINESVLLPIGTIVTYFDDLMPENSVTCTIKYVEPDEEIYGIWYYYLMANNDELNTQVDARFPWKYFTIVHHEAKNVIAISVPTKY